MIYLLGLSLVAQLSACVLAIKLFRFTRRDAGWAFVSLGLLLMLVRRSIRTYLYVRMGDKANIELETEISALVLSVSLALGLAWISPFFQRASEARVKLAEAEQRQQVLFDSVPDLMFVYSGDGRFLDYRRGRQHIAALPPEQFLNRHVAEVLPEHVSRPILDAVQRALRTREIQILEYRLPMKGQMLDWEARFVAVEDDAKVLSIVRDVTQRKRAEAELVERQAQYAAIFDSTSDGLTVLDWDGNIVDCNPAACRMLGASLEEIKSLNPTSFVRPGDTSVHSRFLQQMKEKGSFHEEIVIVRRDGSTFMAEVLGAPFAFKGRPHFLAIGRDISARKKAEEEKRHLEAQIQHTQKLESLGVLAGGIAHDFNNLLTGILGNASLAQMHAASPEARDCLKQIEVAAQRASDLTKQLLAYAGKGRFVIQPIVLSLIVQEMADLLQTVKSKKALLRFDFAAEVPAIEADATQVRQIVMNLITNASDAIGEKSGVISLRTGVLFADANYLQSTFVPEKLEEGIFVFLEVSDTGCGMDAETMEKIFDPFFTTKFTGRGLGLAAVLGIVRGHKGAIKVYSEPQRGTTFKVLFPVKDAMAHPQTPAISPFESWRGQGTVLVVDDEETVRAVAKATLESVGFNVLLAANGREGLEKFRAHGNDIVLVLLDLTMPALGGAETFRELRVLRPALKIVLMSGYNEQEITNQFAGKGLAGFLQKPFRASELLSTVRALTASAP
jgi:PAS domain S-box-containing protein